MPQHKTKVKGSLPVNAKNKRNNKKGPAISKRGNRPVAPKKLKHVESQKLKKIISKTVNESVETELRARALNGKTSLLSKADTAAGGSRHQKKQPPAKK